ncbi:MAG: radical SAM protein [Desulfobulbaceae bacterium]|nr:radical SAM protein [Desulfobulbaceae bacterium]
MKRLYTQSKIFNFPQHLAAVAGGGLPAPIHIRLKPTNRCNHRCSYCCYRNRELYLSELLQEEDQIPQEKMRELVADFAALGVKAVTFSGGGEPLSYPHIYETMQGLRAAQIKIATLTNGSLLVGRIAEFLATNAVWCRISMDAADAETYAALRGVKITEFTKVCDNLRNFAALPGRTCVLGVNFIVTQENCRSIYNFLAMAQELGVDNVKISGAVVSTQPKENGAYHAGIFPIAKPQIDRAIAELTTASFAIIDKLYRPETENSIYDKDFHWCPMINFMAVVAADQQVYFCHDKAYTKNGRIGSLLGSNFRTLWFSPETAARIKNLDPSQECRHHCADILKNQMLLDYFESDPEHLEFV